MPEGHSIHRIARQFQHNFSGKTVEASSPQGRFAEGAALINGTTLLRSFAVGKHLFLEFDDDRWLRVHLGIYGAWDFIGEVTVDPTIASAAGRMGQTNQRGTDLDGLEDSINSIGAPRRTRLVIAEQERRIATAADEGFPPEPVGQVRLRLLTENSVADLRGPTACEILTPEEVDLKLKQLGPDPASGVESLEEGEQEVVDTISRKPTSIALLLMDQSVIAGIGNVYRAEMLFRARLNPFTPGRELSEQQIRDLWRDWVHLLDEGIRTGQMITIDGLEGEQYRSALANRADRHWVYKREGLPCRICGTTVLMTELATRKLYYCPSCQQ